MNGDGSLIAARSSGHLPLHMQLACLVVGALVTGSMHSVDRRDQSDTRVGSMGLVLQRFDACEVCLHEQGRFKQNVLADVVSNRIGNIQNGGLRR